MGFSVWFGFEFLIELLKSPGAESTWMRKLGREKYNLLSQASPLRRPFHSPIPASTLALLACGEFPGTGISKQHKLRKQYLSSSFLLLGVGYAVLVSCPGRKGLGCGEIRFLLWGSYLPAPQQCSGASGVNSPRKVLLTSQSQCLAIGRWAYPF